MANKGNSSEQHCCKCHKSFNRTSFYKTYSTLYTNNGYMPVCKSCLQKIYKELLELYDNDSKKAMKRLCMSFDIYYDDRLFKAADSLDREVTIGNYIKSLNMVQNKDKTMTDSLEEGFTLGEYEKSYKSKKKNNEFDDYDDLGDSDEVRPIDIKRWGDGYKASDYKLLNDHYKYLTEANPNYSSNQEIFIKDLCYNNMLKQNALVERDIDSFKKLSDTYRKTFQEAGLKTGNETVNAEEFSMAVNVRTIEQYTPAEYYRDKKLYKDFDGIGNYFERFVLRPLRNLQHGSSDRDYEYYVSEEGDFDGQTQD